MKIYTITSYFVALCEGIQVSKATLRKQRADRVFLYYPNALVHGRVAFLQTVAVLALIYEQI